MIYYYKIEEEGKLKMIGTQSFPVVEGQTSITEEEYNQLMNEIKAHAEAVRSYAEQLVSGSIEYSAIPEDYREEAGISAAPQFADKIIAGDITIDDVPAEIKDRVQEIVDSRPKNPYGLPDDVYAEIISNAEQSYRDKLVQEVSKNEA